MIEMRGNVLRASALGAILAALAAMPVETVASLPAMCVWRALLDLECPGCGMTRALASLLHGDLAAALAFNRGVLVVFPAMLACVARDLHALCCADAPQDRPA